MAAVAVMKSSPAASKSRRSRHPATAGLPLGTVFKSGNSAALRLPAELQVPVGRVFALTATASGFVAVDLSEEAKRRKVLACLFGSVPTFPLCEP